MRVQVQRRRLATVKSGNVALDRFQDEAAEKINHLLDNPLAQSVAFEIEMAPGPHAVPHTLGRPPRGFYAVGHARGAGHVNDDRVQHPHTANTLNVWVTGSVACNFTLVIW